MHYITEDEVTENITMNEAIQAMEEAFTEYSLGNAVSRPRERLILNGIVYNTMPAILEKHHLAGLKTYIASRKGARFVVAVFDTRSLDLVAIIEANRLGQIRTGALPAMVTSRIVKEKHEPVCIIGSGFQAETQLEGLLARFDPDDIRVYSRTYTNASKFARRMSEILGREVKAYEKVSAATMGARIISSITDSNNAIFSRSDLGKKYHVNLCGGNIPDRREATDEVLSEAGLVIAEDIEQALRESGEIIQFHESHPDRKIMELRDFMRYTGEMPDRTVFKSMGIGLEDVAAAYVVLKNMNIFK